MERESKNLPKMANETNVAQPATEAQPVELTSENLTALRAKYREAYKAMAAHEDPFTKEAKDAKLAAWKIDGEIKAEEARLQKEANDAKMAEIRNQRLQLNENQLSAFRSLVTLEADKKSKPEDVEAAKLAFQTAKEAVDNELLAKYAASAKASKTKTEGDNLAGGDAAAKKAAILEMARAGKTQKEIEEAGYARSTVWHTINNAKKAGETFPA
jgi:hypothetical protein